MKHLTPISCVLFIAILSSCTSPDTKERNQKAMEQNAQLYKDIETQYAINSNLYHDLNDAVMSDTKNYDFKSYYEQGTRVVRLTKEMNDYLLTIQIDLVIRIDKVDEVKAKDRVFDLQLVHHKNSIDKTSFFMGVLGDDHTKGKATEIKTKLLELKQNLRALVSFDSLLTEADLNKTIKGLNVLDDGEELGDQLWEDKHFGKKTLVEVIAELSALRMDLYKAENIMLEHIHSKMRMLREVKKEG